MIFAGGGGRLAAEQVTRLAEALDAPVVTSYNGKGVIPSGHPLHAGSSCEEQAVKALVANADVCLALGTRLAEEYTAHWTVPFPETLVQVDIDAARLGANYPIVEGIVADVGLFCDAVLALGPDAGAATVLLTPAPRCRGARRRWPHRDSRSSLSSCGRSIRRFRTGRSWCPT